MLSTLYGRWLGRFHVYKNKITPKNEAAFRRNAEPDPAPATINPPRAGPTARAILNPTEFSATAEACCLGETISGVIACQAGSFMDAPSPSKNVNVSKTHGVVRCWSVSTPKAPDATTIQT